MLRSMTGFGHCEYTENDITFTIEIKTVNHRYIDIFLRMPKQLSAFEELIRSLVSAKIQRGKIDIYITYDNKSKDFQEVMLDERLAKAYCEALRSISDNLGLRDDISATSLARFPDILKVEKQDNNEEVGKMLEKAFNLAIEKLLEMRTREGEKLKESLFANLSTIEMFVEKINEKAPLVVKEYKEKLETRLMELIDIQRVDPGRIATEVALFADKCSIDEELVRLRSHIIQMREMLNVGSPVGKKADFLIQEMNREVNTIGSKASDIDITRNVVELKSEIEKLREQIQNIE
ncbi:MAG TPA: YicC family protein [Clostridiaceae bacterium]|nr:YicC family protein [Clostridiaceae bacterium]